MEVKDIKLADWVNEWTNYLNLRVKGSDRSAHKSPSQGVTACLYSYAHFLHSGPECVCLCTSAEACVCQLPDVGSLRSDRENKRQQSFS